MVSPQYKKLWLTHLAFIKNHCIPVVESILASRLVVMESFLIFRPILPLGKITRRCELPY